MPLQHSKIGPRPALGSGVAVDPMAVIVALTLTRLARIEQAHTHSLRLPQRAAMADVWHGHVNLDASRALAGGNATVAAFFAPWRKAGSGSIVTAGAPSATGRMDPLRVRAA